MGIRACASRLADTVLNLLYPPRCPFCGVILTGGTREEVSGICVTCEASLPWKHEVLRTLPEGLLCAGPLSYEGVVRDALLKFKFHGESASAEPLGKQIALCVSDCFAGAFDIVSWVPVSGERKRRRGYDQAELLAKAAAKTWGLRPHRLLVKITDNPPQSGLSGSAARRENVAGVYALAQGAAVQGQRILLIDDICTTGATLLECRRTLLQGGAASVLGAAVTV